MVGWQHWRIVCLEGPSIEDLEDLYLFGRMITGFLPIGAGLALAYRRLKKAVTAVQNPTRQVAIEGRAHGSTGPAQSHAAGPDAAVYITKLSPHLPTPVAVIISCYGVKSCAFCGEEFFFVSCSHTDLLPGTQSE